MEAGVWFGAGRLCFVVRDVCFVGVGVLFVVARVRKGKGRRGKGVRASRKG